KAFARPVAGGPEPLQLVDDGAAALGLPLPDALEEFRSAHIAAAGLLPLHQLALHHHLRRDAGVVRSVLPERVLAAHALEAGESVLRRVVERVAYMQRARHIRWRDHDGEGRSILALGPAGPERPALLPDLGHAAFNVGGLVILLNHDEAGFWDLRG